MKNVFHHRIALVVLVLLSLPTSLALAPAPSAPTVQPVKAPVLKREQSRCITALDGDSLLVEGPAGRFQIRLLGVDCPEKGQEYSNVAREMSRTLCKGKIVELEYGPRRTDRYGRTLAYVYVEGKMLNEMLVLRGLALAVSYDQDEPQAERLAQAETQARKERTGFWSKGGLEITPRRFRELHRR